MSGRHRLGSLIDREPVRVYLYGVAVAVGALAAALDLVDAADVPVWLGLAGAVLAVPTVELTRATVTSPATAHELTLAAAARPTGNELAAGLRELAARPDVDSRTSSVLLDAALDLDRGMSPLVVMSKLVAVGLS